MDYCERPIPADITAGLDFQSVVRLRDYPATLWTLQLIARGPSNIGLTATAQGTDFILAAPAATTETWSPGTYWYSLRVSQLASISEIQKGQFSVLPDLAAVSTPYDGRSQNEIALDALNAVIGKRATIDQSRYKINERELWRMPIAELLKMRSFYTVQVRRERARASGCNAFGRPVHVRFDSQ